MPKGKQDHSEGIRKIAYLDYPALLKIKIKATGNKEGEL